MMPDLYMSPSGLFILFRLFSCDLYFQTETVQIALAGILMHDRKQFILSEPWPESLF